MFTEADQTRVRSGGMEEARARLTLVAKESLCPETGRPPEMSVT